MQKDVAETGGAHTGSCGLPRAFEWACGATAGAAAGTRVHAIHGAVRGGPDHPADGAPRDEPAAGAGHGGLHFPGTPTVVGLEF